jgi:hypothetical protein
MAADSTTASLTRTSDLPPSLAERAAERVDNSIEDTTAISALSTTSGAGPGWTATLSAGDAPPGAPRDEPAPAAAAPRLAPPTPQAPPAYGNDESSPRGTSSGAGAHPTTETPPKKKQKRNKPTLSCEECVERKTKVSIPQMPNRAAD